MTLEQQRAALAFQHVQAVTDPEDRKLYGSMAQKLPVLIHTAGLCQALHFVKSRNERILGVLLGHLALQLQRTNPNIMDAETLCARVRQATLTEYLMLTREALASATWYARLAQSELKVDRTGDGK